MDLVVLLVLLAYSQGNRVLEGCTALQHAVAGQCTCNYEVGESPCTQETVRDCENRVTTENGLDATLSALFNAPPVVDLEFRDSLYNFDFISTIPKEQLDTHSLSLKAQFLKDQVSVLDLEYYYTPLVFYKDSQFSITQDQLASVCTSNTDIFCTIEFTLANPCTQTTILTFKRTLIFPLEAAKTRFGFTQVEKNISLLCGTAPNCTVSTEEELSLTLCKEEDCTAEGSSSIEDIDELIFFKTEVKEGSNREITRVNQCILVTYNDDNVPLSVKDCEPTTEETGREGTTVHFKSDLNLSKADLISGSDKFSRVSLKLVFQFKTETRILASNAILSGEQVLNLQVSDAELTEIAETLTYSEIKDPSGRMLQFVLVFVLLVACFFLLVLVLFFVTKNRASPGEINVLGTI